MTCWHLESEKKTTPLKKKKTNLGTIKSMSFGGTEKCLKVLIYKIHTNPVICICAFLSLAQ